ncbi:SacI homology domain-containing protein [Chytriomyces sp. MP71]|nr:SacI homology domain-containing protein [Chytriomyces sp. MP71]
MIVLSLTPHSLYLLHQAEETHGADSITELASFEGVSVSGRAIALSLSTATEPVPAADSATSSMYAINSSDAMAKFASAVAEGAEAEKRAPATPARLTVAGTINSVASLASNLAHDLSAQPIRPILFLVPAIVGFVELGAARTRHLVIVSKRRKVGSLAGSGVYVVDQVAIVPLDFSQAIAALMEAISLASDVSGTLVGAALHARTRSVETAKAGIGAGLGVVSATLNVISASIPGSPRAKPSAMAGADEASENATALEGDSSPRSSGDEARAATTSSKLLSALNPFKVQPLRVANHDHIVSSSAPDLILEGNGTEFSEDGTYGSKTLDGEVDSCGSATRPASSSSTTTKLLAALNPFKSSSGTSSKDSAAFGSPDGGHNTISEPGSPGMTPKQKSGSMLNVSLSSLSSLLPGQIVQPGEVTQDNVAAADVKALLELDTFFYTEGAWDLTRTAQTQREPCDERFFWNKHSLGPLSEIEDAKSFVKPLIQGFVEVCKAEGRAGQAGFEFALVSRRNKHRAGLRYERRGVDALGRVANFVESEMIIFAEIEDRKHVGSFLQIRGSIPLFWQQIASTKTLNPTPILDKTDEQNIAAMKLHVDELEKLYKSIIMVDLVGQEGREEPLGTKFKASANALRENGHDSTLIYHAYDFHAQTKGLHYENLKSLLEKLEAEIENMKFYWSLDGESMLHQSAIIRTNCMDCLDRTNVVQSLFARHMLTKILVKIGLPLLDPDTPTLTPGFESQFKNMWADNGDALSTAYTGTGALKGDYTRTGVRNVRGMMNDAANSVGRLYADNFQNKLKQATVDLFLGAES